MRAISIIAALFLGLTSTTVYAEGISRILLWQEQIQQIEEPTLAPQTGAWSLRYALMWQDQVFDWRSKSKSSAAKTVTKAKPSADNL